MSRVATLMAKVVTPIPTNAKPNAISTAATMTAQTDPNHRESQVARELNALDACGSAIVLVIPTLGETKLRSGPGDMPAAHRFVSGLYDPVRANAAAPVGGAIGTMPRAATASSVATAIATSMQYSAAMSGNAPRSARVSLSIEGPNC
jgi:hypothetical protein